MKSVRHLHVYRLLRSDEDSSTGIFPRDDYDMTITPAEHIEKGSCPSLRSHYISASKSYKVCLFYANKSICERHIDPSLLRIAKIKLDLFLQDVWDVYQAMTR